MEITNTPEDRKDPIKKNQLFISIDNLSDKICKIKSISVKTMPMNPSDKSLTLNHDRDLLVKELNQNGIISIFHMTFRQAGKYQQYLSQAGLFKVKMALVKKEIT